MSRNFIWGLTTALNICCIAPVVSAAEPACELCKPMPTYTAQKVESTTREKSMPVVPVRKMEMQNKMQTMTAANDRAPASMPALNTMMKSEQLYTINNDPQQNAIIVLNRNNDGSLTAAGAPIPLGGKGLIGGDIDEQGAVRVHGRFVLAVNPGSQSIAVLQRKGDQLTPVAGSPFASGGFTPLSLSAHGNMVYVANQATPFSNPTSAPNVMGFQMSKDGRLTPIANSKINFPSGEGPAQIEFSPNGKFVAVTSGFQNEPSSRIHNYVVQKDGTLVPVAGSAAQPNGASGVVGYSWSPDSNRLFVSNFRGSAIVTFNVDPMTGALHQMGDALPNGEQAACWTAISADGKTLYAANFVSNSISVYDVATDGQLKLLSTTKRRTSMNGPDTKDITLSADGKTLYAVASGAREIAVFQVNADRSLTELPSDRSPLKVTTGQNITGLAAASK
jgi:6-phosphogluconolactonase